jgi:hypothetical protein
MTNGGVGRLIIDLPSGLLKNANSVSSRVVGDAVRRIGLNAQSAKSGENAEKKC